MKTLQVALDERSYPIYIGHNLLNQAKLLTQHIRGRRVCIISNDTVFPLYGEQLSSLLTGYQVSQVILPDGEAYKSLASFEKIMTHMLEQAYGRDSCILALGGGVIGDIAGFAASCYQRGIDFIQIPTTLLSQVDSSVGGKTAVNHPLGKNMIGAFYQPKAVIIDTNTLNTLPEREFSAGMAEVIKYGILGDAALFDWIVANKNNILQQHQQTLAELIAHCCQNKADIVAADERESGVRALLNLGHTFGHAIEAELGYGNWLHGEAVAAGTVIAAKVAEAMNLLQSSEVCQIENLFQVFNLPTKAPKNMGYEAFVKHMLRDKKNINGEIRFVIPEKIGKCKVRSDVTEDILQQIL